MYSTRIIKLQDSKIIDDSNPFKIDNKKVDDNKKVKRTSMNLLKAFSLSLNNLLTKKRRTVLTEFEGNIGIIGIELILSVSTGLQNYMIKFKKIL